LGAARDVFLERGYATTTVEHIIERANSSRATFYAHFHSKADIISVLIESIGPEINDSYRQLEQAILAGSRDELRAWFDFVIDWSDRFGWLRLVVDQAYAAEPEQRGKGRSLVASLADLMPRYLASWPAHAQAEARQRVLLLSVHLNGLFEQSPAGEMGPAERALNAELLTNIWFDVLRPGSSAVGRGDAGVPFGSI
jgi:AcrR family transcriptional regulator